MTVTIGGVSYCTESYREWCSGCRKVGEGCYCEGCMLNGENGKPTEYDSKNKGNEG